MYLKKTLFIFKTNGDKVFKVEVISLKLFLGLVNTLTCLFAKITMTALSLLFAAQYTLVCTLQSACMLRSTSTITVIILLNVLLDVVMRINAVTLSSVMRFVRKMMIALIMDKVVVRKDSVLKMKSVKEINKQVIIAPEIVSAYRCIA